ncbi:MAG: ABC transporter ATP-binding protein [Candidatus Bathyarchaeota archaeon]|nr:ABC transporter ATP-binding protein [Candidatus Bathyarchaeota archaeon]
MSFDTIIELEDLSRHYEMGGVTIRALDGVDIQVGRGEYVSIVGPSGSGKTTLFNMIGGLDRPTKGRVYIDGVDISQLDAYELAWLRCRKIGYIFQTFNLIPVLTAVENVSLPTVFAGVPRDEGLERAEKLLTSVGLGERLQHKPTELSAGQQQRVAIARAMANDPAIILADEPTGNLDLNTGMEIIDLLHGLNRTRGMTLIAATHDLKMIKASDRIVWMRDGKIEKIERG